MIPEADKAIERRFDRNTHLVIVVATIASLIWSGWRLALGLMVGGAWGLLITRWLQGSVRAILNQAVIQQNARVPSFTASKLILRYFIIAIVIGVGFWSGYFDPIGIGIGFAAFVGGVMIEAVYQLYMSFKSTENE